MGSAAKKHQVPFNIESVADYFRTPNIVQTTRQLIRASYLLQHRTEVGNSNETYDVQISVGLFQLLHDFLNLK